MNLKEHDWSSETSQHILCWPWIVLSMQVLVYDQLTWAVLISQRCTWCGQSAVASRSSAHAAASKLSTDVAHLLFTMLPWQMFHGSTQIFPVGLLLKRYSARVSCVIVRCCCHHIAAVSPVAWLQQSSSFVHVALFHTLPFRYRKCTIFSQIWRNGEGCPLFWQFEHCVL